MGDSHFNENDQHKVVAFLNMVAKHATFQLSTEDMIKYLGLLTYMQKSLLPKIDANIFEIKRVVDTQPQKAPADNSSE